MKRHRAIHLRFWQVAFLLVMWSAALADDPASTRSTMPHFDAYGDPLPPHAVLRLGTTRLHHQAFIQDTAFSPDGRILASAAGNQDAAVSLWELPSGRLLRRLAAPLDDNFRPWVNALAFSPDGTKLLTGEMRGTLRLCRRRVPRREAVL
jgi:WD40 repeat protein